MPRQSIYTRKGDKGDTSLPCGMQLPKDASIIEAFGTIDELSSLLGVVSALLNRIDKEEERQWRTSEGLFVEWVQERLFILSSMIATINSPQKNFPQLTQEDIDLLEQRIDDMDRDLPELCHFIIPNGSELTSFVHLARTVCRRSERVCTGLNHDSPLPPLILPFLNRLGDLLFVMARWVSFQMGEKEKIWLGRKQVLPDGQ